ncbi:MAG TPA: Ada metal-binding domain-containing protein [Ktedonobacterales bacterium]
MMTTEAPEGTTSANGKNRWFQLGLVSAGTLAPLIARWRALRAAEQAEALREQAAERWNETIAWVAASRPQDAIQEALQETLRQVAPQTQDALRRLGPSTREALQRLSWPASSAAQGEPAAPPTMTPPARIDRRVNATLWVVGVSVGLVAAGSIAYVLLRRRMTGRSDDDALVEIPLTAVTSADSLARADALARAEATAAPSTPVSPTPTTTDGPAFTEESPEDEPGAAEELDFSDADAEGAAFVGNILSRVYHPAQSSRLPAPQHRIYFASEEEAIAAGYRPDGSGMASRGAESSGQRD